MNELSQCAFNFFALLRQIEHANPDKPLLGNSTRLRDDPVRMGQQPYFDFATQDFKQDESIQTELLGEVRKLYVQNFGLLGPNGALPLHYTEHAYTRIHQYGDSTFSEFLDIFHHRAYLLFYRAWADSQPHIAYHRKAFNPFAHHLNSLVGHGESTSWRREVLPIHFRAGLAGHFTRRSKTQEGLASALSAITGLPVQIIPFQAQWLSLRSKSGLLAQGLGLGAMLGHSVWCAQSKIQINVGPMRYLAYLGLLAGTEGRSQLTQATHAYLGLEFDCEYEFQIKPDSIPRVRLNGVAMLGRTAWIGDICKREQKAVAVRVKCPAVPAHSSLVRSSV